MSRLGRPSNLGLLGSLALIGLLLGCALGAAPAALDPGSGTGGAFLSESPLPAPTAGVSPSPAPATRLSLTSSPLPSLTPTLGASPSPATQPTLTTTPVPAPALTSVPGSTPQPPAPVHTYRIVHTYPHDREAYTQGLVFDQEVLYEGTGKKGASTLRRVQLETGKVLQLRALPEQFFGEGIAVVGDKIVQLTWKSHVGFVYEKDSFQPLATFGYPTEGWGITYNGRELIMSDGTPTLHFLDPDTFREIGQVQVRDGETPVGRLNELEYVGGEIYANVWQTDYVARIDPQTGRVIAWINLAGLLAPEDYQAPVPPNVLNGIAYDPEMDRLFVTGKRWPKLFEIEVVPPGNRD